jgi:hypothetical protein
VVVIDKSLTLAGGWNAAFTTQNGTSIIDGQEERRGVSVREADTVVVLDRFVIQNGADPEWNKGGGIANYYGTLTVNNTTVRNNIIIGGTGPAGGGGIYNSGTLTLNNSTVSQNIVMGGFQGSGILNQGTARLNNSTISSNTGGDGGLYNEGTLVINNSTISRNQPYGIYNIYGSTVLSNSILALNGPNGDCSGSLTTQGYNLVGMKPAACTLTAGIGDLVGTSASPANPRLTLLQDNGGVTLTHALITGSLAIDTGNPATPGSGSTACLVNDQRGTARPVGTRCDKGAYEGNVTWTPAYLVSTYTANHTASLPGTLVCSQNNPLCPSSNFRASVAHEHAIGVYKLYASQFNRNSLDNKGMTIVSTVDYRPDPNYSYDNSFWNGSQAVYGDDIYSFPAADDVVAHELTHGVTQYESNLFYYYQSGAINESLSDIWGEYYDQTNLQGNDSANVLWLLGEDILASPYPGQALRNMSNPPEYGDPDKMSSTIYCIDEADNGCVHANSGVNNKAAYLLVAGGTFNGKTVTALGWTKTTAIYYEANANLLVSGADYSDLYYALQQACSNLVGQKGITGADCAEVKDALDAVEMNRQPTRTPNADAPLCATGSAPVMVFADDLEAGTANWTFTNGAYPRWQRNSPYGPYAQSGLYSLYADDYPPVVTDAAARLKPVLIPNKAYLHFAQAYDFESQGGYDYDGGVLEYSINNGATWIDAGTLMDYNGYNGRIFEGINNPSYDNPLKSRFAFVHTSYGYLSTRLNLASLAGKTVTFRWRIGLDKFGYDWGWWVDNIKLYTCAQLPGTFGKTSPANGATNQAGSLTLSWGPSAGATSYQFCYDTTNDNACSNWMGNGVATSKVLSGLSPGTTYYWQVRSLNGNGTTYANGNPTTFWSFTTMPLPGAFSKTAPANGGTGIGLSPTLTWGSSSLASSYQYCYDSINDNQCNRTWNTVTNTSAIISNLGTNTTYYWQVRAVNTGGTTYADAQSWRNFTTTSTLPPEFTEVEAFVGTTNQGKYSLDSGQSLRESYTGVNNGPVKLGSTNAVPLLGAERVIYKVNGVNTSFTEMMALPDKQLDTTYWLPWYNNVDLDTQLRFANVSGSTATVHVFIGETEVTPAEGITLAAGASTRVSYAGANAGPVQIVSDQNIVAAERLIYKVNGVNTSFTEMMALPNKQLDKTYWLPWYNNVDLDTQLRVANVTDQPATVTVTIGGVPMTPIALAAGESTRVSYAGVNDGPVKIVSTQNIVAAERLIYKVNKVPTSFTEMMALPDGQLDTTYWLPWYNNKDLDTQLRFANTTDQTATVHVYIGGQEMGSGFTLQPGESTRQSFPGINAGPVQIVSTQNIVAAERLIYKVNNMNTSFSEMMALPNSQLDTLYWLPWYNNVDLDTQLRFGVP